MFKFVSTMFWSSKKVQQHWLTNFFFWFIAFRCNFKLFSYRFCYVFINLMFRIFLCLKILIFHLKGLICLANYFFLLFFWAWKFDILSGKFRKMKIFRDEPNWDKNVVLKQILAFPNEVMASVRHLVDNVTLIMI